MKCIKKCSTKKKKKSEERNREFLFKTHVKPHEMLFSVCKKIQGVLYACFVYTLLKIRFSLIASKQV